MKAPETKSETPDMRPSFARIEPTIPKRQTIDNLVRRIVKFLAISLL